MSKSSLSSVVSNLVRASMGSSVSNDVADTDLDRHVAELILKEAKQKGERYNTDGIQAYLKNGVSNSNAPKANKRFLSSIIRNTDDHNKTILRAQLLAAQEVKKAREEQERREKRARAEEAAAAERNRRLRGRARRGDSDKWSHRKDRDRTRKRKTREWEELDGVEEEDHIREKRELDSRRRRHLHRSRSDERNGAEEERRRSKRSYHDSISPSTSAGHKRSRPRSTSRSTYHDDAYDDDYHRYDRRGNRHRHRSSHKRRRHRSRSTSSERRSRSRSVERGNARISRRKSRSDNHDDILESRLHSKSRRHRSSSLDDDGIREPKSPHRLKTKYKGDGVEQIHIPHSRSRSRTSTPDPQPRYHSSHRCSPRGSSRSLSSMSCSPSPPPQPPLSKMDKYFEESYDPRLDVAPLASAPKVPATGLIDNSEFEGWDAMLDLIRIRKVDKAEQKALERLGLVKNKKDKKGRGLDVESVKDRWRADSQNIMEIEYKKRGSVREWDLGKVEL